MNGCVHTYVRFHKEKPETGIAYAYAFVTHASRYYRRKIFNSLKRVLPKSVGPLKINHYFCADFSVFIFNAVFSF